MGKRKKVIKENTIYVQIAAYRDPELLKTLDDCLSKAKYPENLRIGIAWQHSPYEDWDQLNDYKDDTRFKILDIDYRDARGPCFARHLLNEHYGGETYTLQLDSHHRFVENWDILLIDMLEQLRKDGYKKPALTSYLPSYDPSNDPAGRVQSPWVMEFDRFAPEGPVHFLPHTIDNFKELNSPVPTRFCSGHFIFADGSFVKDVPYDPNYYFHGEEINLSVRAYMAGYDLFAPHCVMIWHEYTRNNKKKHWDDHPNWPELDKHSHRHNREILGIDDPSSEKKLEKHERTLKDYEIYAGLEFSTRRAHKLTVEKKIPPVSLTEEEHDIGLVNYHKVCVDVYRPLFTENDYTFWAVAFEDESGKEIARLDAGPEEIQRMLSISVDQDKFIHIWRNFYSETLPTKWIVWPHSESKGWQERLTGDFPK